ncbi:hypothetical protein [Tessaracoccus sp.]|nr:hypothetical protein [Tessaracoccus sp.]
MLGLLRLRHDGRAAIDDLLRSPARPIPPTACASASAGAITGLG